MQVADQNGGLTEPAFRLLRLFLQFLIFFAAVAACRWGMRTFLLNHGGKSNRWRSTFSSLNFAVIVLLLLLRTPAEKLLTAFGDSISQLRSEADVGWLAPMLVGLYYALIATSILFLTSYVLGLVHRVAERRFDAWQLHLRAAGLIESSPRFHASRIARICIHLLFTLLATALVLAYFVSGFAIFPKTRIFTADLLRIVGPPLRDAAQSVENYVPNLGYLFVILVFGWILLKALKYLFAAIQRGTIVFEKFPVYWAEPTYKLSRTILLLFVLMVSFPYLPGAHSAFFRGFSVFIGALVTFGSSGIIGNLLAGILLTYARAFKVGDVVQIEGVFGKVTEKTLFITRIAAAGRVHVAVPNGKVLADSVTNFSAHNMGEGFSASVSVTIGYDVDWRTVHKLLLEGAARTPQIATEPAPRVMETSFGDYSVEYGLRAWTKTSEEIFDTLAALRRNVLDSFADAGVEIMTPTILSHRDASDLAVPRDRFPDRSQPQGIRITLDRL